MSPDSTIIQRAMSLANGIAETRSRLPVMVLAPVRETAQPTLPKNAGRNGVLTSVGEHPDLNRIGPGRLQFNLSISWSGARNRLANLHESEAREE